MVLTLSTQPKRRSGGDAVKGHREPLDRGQLSWLEQLCLKSFADAGHRVTLYSYDPIDNVPASVETADAREVFAPDNFLRHKRTGSPAIHADVWRLHLLQKTDKVWVDADVYCWRPFDQQGDHIFGYEKKNLVCNAVLRLPRSSPALSHLMDFFAQAPELQGGSSTDRETPSTTPLGEMKWGATGPKALTQALNDTGEISHAAPKDVYYPVSFPDRNKMLMSRFNIEEGLTENTRAIHFWARRLKPRMAEKMNNRPRRGSFLHGLLKKHDISTADAPIPGWVRPDTLPDDASEKSLASAAKYLIEKLTLARSTSVVHVGVSPDEVPPYALLSRLNACHVTGFEPQADLVEKLRSNAPKDAVYHPYAIGDGSEETLHILRQRNLSSLQRPHAGAVHYLGRSKGNISISDTTPVKTHRLDDLDDLGDVDLVRIDAQGGEGKILAGAPRVLSNALVVIPSVRFYRLYEDEPMIGGIDGILRGHGFTLHKFSEPRSKVIPNSQINRLVRKHARNQIFEGDAIYIRDPAKVDELSHGKLRHFAILAATVVQSFDLALYLLDALVARGYAADDLPSGFVDALPAAARKD